MIEGKNMNPELEKLRKELEIAVNNPNMDMEKITEISCKIDEKIAELFHITRYQLRQILKNNRIK